MTPTIDPSTLALFIALVLMVLITACLFIAWIVHLGAAISDVNDLTKARELGIMTLYFGASVALLVGVGALL